MRLTKEHILELFGQLPTDIECDYVNPGIYSVKRKPIEGNEVHFALYENDIDTLREVPLTEAAMETMANAIKRICRFPLILLWLMVATSARL